MNLDLDNIQWSTGKPAPRGTRTATTGIRSVEQTRIDRIWSPPPTLFRAYLKWMDRFRREAADFATPELVERAEELVALVAERESLLRDYPPKWKGPDWEKAHDQLLRWQGQQQAIAETLARRARAVPWLTNAEVAALAGSCSAPGSKPTTCSAAPEWDPFAGE